MSYVNSATVIMRNNTIEGGAIGASYTGDTTDISLLDNIFDNQTFANVYFDSTCLEESVGSDGSTMPAYEGDGNIYNPASGGYVGTVAGTNTRRSIATRNTGTCCNTRPPVAATRSTLMAAVRALARGATSTRSRGPRPLSPSRAAISGWPPSLGT